MANRWRNRESLVRALVLALVVLGSANVQGGGILDTIKDKWRQREHNCKGCGAVIHVGDKCAACVARDAREAWRKSEHKCVGCGAVIHVGEKCMACLGRAAADKLRAALRSDALKQWGQRLLEGIRDPERQRQVLEAAGAAIKLKREWDTAKNEASYRALTALGGVRIRTDRGDTTLADAFRAYVLEKAPGLRGTDIVDDPAKVLAYGLIGRDKSYIVGELKIIKKDGRAMTIRDAIAASGHPNLAAALKALDEMAASGDVSADRVAGAAEALLGAINESSGRGQ